MTVYVDNMFAQFGRMKMCHMIADTPEELRAMAAKIGIAEKWIQYPGTVREHFDVATSKRLLAIELGAVPITWRELGAKIRDRRMTRRKADG